MKSKNTEDSNKIKEKLLEVGLKHYLKLGAGDLSVRKLAAECDVNLGSFVYHFGTKEKFIAALFDRHYSKLMTRFNQGLSEMPTEKDPMKTLRHLVGIMTEFVQENPAFLGRLILDHMSGDKTITKIIMKYRPRHIPIMMSLIEECQKKGLMRKEMSPMQTGLCGMFVGGIVHVFGLMAAQNMPGLIGQKLKEEILDPKFRESRIEMVMRGLAV